MPKPKRASVPLSAEIQRELRVMSAENGRSTASNLANLIEAGLQKTDVSQQLNNLRNQLQTHQPESVNDAEILPKIEKILNGFRAEIAEKLAKTGTENRNQDGVFLPEAAAALLFEEAFFSAKLSAEIVVNALPGSPPKPPGQLISAARQKAKAAMADLIKLCQEQP